MTNQKNSLHAIFFDDIRGKRKKYVNKDNTKRAARDVTALFVWLIGSVRGFRPLAGFPYLSFPRRYGGSGEQCEPMGALVACDHFCRYGWFTACVHGAPSGTLRVPPPPLWQGRLEIRSVPLWGSPILASPVATGEVASNASRWGRFCLACTSVAMDGLRLAFMAPPPPLTRSPC
mgnify:CR=1 FL=1